MRLAIIAVAWALGAGAALAAPYEIAPDASGGAWVLDTRSGAVSRCAPRALAGPKLTDSFGSGQAPAVYAGPTRCTEVRAGADDVGEHRLRAVLRARTGTFADLYGPGIWLGRPY